MSTTQAAAPTIKNPGTKPTTPHKLFVNIPVSDLQRSITFFEALGFGAVGVMRAPVPGRRVGNREYPLRLVQGARVELDEARIEEAVGGG